jgi:hypothetical protein
MTSACRVLGLLTNTELSQANLCLKGTAYPHHTSPLASFTCGCCEVPRNQHGPRHEKGDCAGAAQKRGCKAYPEDADTLSLLVRRQRKLFCDFLHTPVGSW